MTRGLNGEIALSREDVYVGTVPGTGYGYKRNLRVTVTVTMERLDRRDEYETTDHRKVRRPLDFSITTAVWHPDWRDIVSGGATVEPLAELTGYAPGFDAGKATALVKLAGWHLNGMTAGCDHVAPVMETDGYGRTVPSLDLTPPCPVTGYRYGSAWLVRELPAGFLDMVRRYLPGR